MGVTTTKGGLELGESTPYSFSTLEQAENREADSRRRKPARYPLMMFKRDGLTKIVEDAKAETAALSNGWYADIRDVPSTEPEIVPAGIAGLTLPKAKKVIAKASSSELAALELEERAGANRAEVLALIEAAKDAVR